MHFVIHSLIIFWLGENYKEAQVRTLAWSLGRCTLLWIFQSTWAKEEDGSWEGAQARIILRLFFWASYYMNNDECFRLEHQDFDLEKKENHFLMINNINCFF